MLRSTLAIAYRRTVRSLAVSPPSLNTGAPNRFVVAISTPRPVSASAFLNRSRVASRVASSGTRSSSWKVTAAAPSSARRCTASTGSSSGRTAPPKTSTPCQPTVHRPKLNLSSLLGVYGSVTVEPSTSSSGGRGSRSGKRTRDGRGHEGGVGEHRLEGDVRAAAHGRGEAEAGQGHAGAAEAGPEDPRDQLVVQRCHEE